MRSIAGETPASHREYVTLYTTPAESSLTQMGFWPDADDQVWQKRFYDFNV